ncbi:MAG: 50S ribosomal protein L13 [Ignavibacteriae bacterium]|nr:50S ribosomal protein L13 [Ignavibacteriota bacterium]MCB9217309.1 50S ribosomal protein L13 [Ignavibacteria bacterium]
MTPNKITASVKASDANSKWWVIDATGMKVGRLATQVATLLRGKHKPTFTPHTECGDAVVVINADKVELAAKRAAQKEYNWYTGYPGGRRTETFQEAMARHPERVIERAVWGMLPKNRLGRRLYKNLRVYAGEAHPHTAQVPEVLDIKK